MVDELWDDIWECPIDEVDRVQTEFWRSINAILGDGWDDEYERKRELEEDY